jgi:hypothetical protein
MTATATKSTAKANGKLPEAFYERARIAAAFGNFKPTSTTSPRDHAKIDAATRKVLKPVTAEGLGGDARGRRQGDRPADGAVGATCRRAPRGMAAAAR